MHFCNFSNWTLFQSLCLFYTGFLSAFGWIRHKVKCSQIVNRCWLKRNPGMIDKKSGYIHTVSTWLWLLLRVTLLETWNAIKLQVDTEHGKRKHLLFILELFTKASIQFANYHQRQVDNKIKEKAKSNQDQDTGYPYQKSKRFIYAFAVADHKYGLVKVL